MAKSKKEILEMFSKNLEYFDPKFKNHFICPVCLKKIPISKQSDISEAHIIPKAAGGDIKTYLCRKCNSFLGANQDKWFGELIRLHLYETASMFSSKIKDRYFMIDGVKVNGRWKEDENKNLTFYTYRDRNSPETMKTLDEIDKKKLSKRTYEISIPLMRNERMVAMGFITAAYLMWFRAIGYSWVFQQYLDPFREQILNPKQIILKRRYIAHFEGAHWKPWIGFIPMMNEIVLAFGISDQMVFFPPRYNPDMLNNLQSYSYEIDRSEIRPVHFSDYNYFGPPVVLMFNDKLLSVPDMLHNIVDSTIVYRFTNDRNEADILSFINDDEFETMKNKNNIEVTKVHLNS